VHVSRLSYRKGTDLLIDIIPTILKKYPNVHFIIGGDGDKRAILEKMRVEHGIEDRVEMLGFLRGCEAVRNTLVRGHIFLNVSLTESFCIAILEAACAGLRVVTTDVGGIPEVLPGEMMFAAKPNAKDLIAKIEEAIPLAKNTPSYEFHNKI
jgi:phosphatidylinositol glycan class A protein